MAISIRGIRIDSISITKEGDEQKITGNYSIITTADKVLAKQGFNGYNDMKIVPSASTIKLLDDFLNAFKTDIESVTGLSEKGGD